MVLKEFYIKTQNRLEVLLKQEDLSLDPQHTEKANGGCAHLRRLQTGGTLGLLPASLSKNQGTPGSVRTPSQGNKDGGGHPGSSSGLHKCAQKHVHLPVQICVHAPFIIYT